MQGDFNTRTGNQPDFIAKDKYDEVFGIENPNDNPSRNPEEKKTCERSALLLNLCRSLDFRIANGRKSGDILGKYTFQWNGNGKVDYLMMSLTAFHKITEFKVGKYHPWLSDHCPLFYTITLTHGTKPKTEESGMQTQNIKKEFDDIVRENCTPDECIWRFFKTLLKCVNVDTEEDKIENVYPREIMNHDWIKNVKIFK